MKPKKLSVRDRILKLLGAKDEKELKEALDGMEEGEGATREAGGAEGLQVHVHNYGPNGEGKNEADDKAKDGEEVEGEKAEKAEGGTMEERMARLEALLEKLVNGTADEAEKKEEGEVENKDSAEEGEEGEKKEQEGKSSKTSDAVSSAYREVAARAEILSPGFKMSVTADAFRSTDPKKAKDALCKCKRKALDSAFRADATRDALAPFKLDVLKADCATVDATFIAASELIKAKNNGKATVGTTDARTSAPLTPAEINKRNAEFWKGAK